MEAAADRLVLPFVPMGEQTTEIACRREQFPLDPECVGLDIDGCDPCKRVGYCLIDHSLAMDGAA